MFYSYDPERGIEFHPTAEQAMLRAEKALDDAKFSAADSDWHWNDNEDEISWGEVRGIVAMNDRELTPEEKAENPEWDFYRDPKLVCAGCGGGKVVMGEIDGQERCTVTEPCPMCCGVNAELSSGQC